MPALSSTPPIDLNSPTMSAQSSTPRLALDLPLMSAQSSTPPLALQVDSPTLSTITVIKTIQCSRLAHDHCRVIETISWFEYYLGTASMIWILPWSSKLQYFETCYSRGIKMSAALPKLCFTVSRYYLQGSSPTQTFTAHIIYKGQQTLFTKSSPTDLHSPASIIQG